MIESGRIDHETTCNVGKISGGQARNIVPDNTKVMLEARSLDQEKLKKVTGIMVDALEKGAKDAGASLDYNLYREYEGFHIGEDELPLKASVKALENMGIKPVISSSGGGSDINIFNARGKRAVNLSSGMEDVHTSNEYVKEYQLKLLGQLVLEICDLKI